MSDSSFARSVSSALLVLSVAAVPAAAQAPVPPLPPAAEAPATGQPPLEAGQTTPQAPATLVVSGQVRRARTLAPVAKATIIVEGTALETTSDKDGRFSIANVPGGSRHVIIAAPGLMPLRADLTIVGGVAAPLDAILDVEVHYTEVVSVSPEARDQFASYQPTSVLAGQDLSRELEGTLGATLGRQPGVAERSFGPGPSRPVIRGLDGDRVLILQDGQRVGDLSSQSGDHGVPINPATASRIEVVRGPATLLYGANAIGGLVNVISETIPTRPVEGVHGTAVFDYGSAAREVLGAGDLSVGNGRWAMHAGASARRNGDVRTPEGRVANTQSRGGFGNVGLSWTGARGYAGGSYGYDDTRYGIPVVEEGQVELTPRRHQVALKAEASQLGGVVNGIRADYASRRYRHEEVVAGEIGTRFENDTDELNVLVRHRPAGRLTGTVGGWFLHRQFVAEGEEALSPPVRERGAAAFFYEELTWPHVTFQFGARLNHASYEPERDRVARRFTDTSASAGVVFRPAAAGDRLTLAVNLARASRNPALEELYFLGPHPGNFAFEIGNDALQSERALGVDVSLRWRAPRVTGEITYFRNSIDDFIYREPIDEADLDPGVAAEIDALFGHEGHDELPFARFVATDSLLQGVESHADIPLAGGLRLELGLDYLRGTLRQLGEPLPRMPPFRGRAGLNYSRNAFRAGGEVVAVSRQARVARAETATPGYGLVKLFSSYSFDAAGVTHTITARVDNATDETYRNHLSLIKDFVAEPGRSAKLVYSMTF